MLWLYLDFYALQLDALTTDTYASGEEATGQTDTNKAPVILVEAKRHVVVQHNREAGALGIEVGMGLAMAMSLAHYVSVREYKSEFEAAKLKQIAQLLYRFSADIALDPPQGLFLRIDNMLKLHHGVASYWQNLQQPLAVIGIRYRYATGCTPLMAKLLAKTGRNAIDDDPIKMTRVLNQLQVRQLALPNKTEQTLKRVGINQLGQLLTLPMKELARRFDIHLLNYIGRVTGALKHGLPLYQPPLHFYAELELMFEVTHTQVLITPICKLLKQMEQYLQLHALVAHSIHFALMYRYDECLEVRVTRVSGEYKAHKWLHLLELKLESVQLEEPVSSLRLWANKLRPQSAMTEDLFEASGTGIEEEELISLLQAKLGNDNVLSMHCRAAHHPQLTTELHTIGSEAEQQAAKDKLADNSGRGERMTVQAKTLTAGQQRNQIAGSTLSKHNALIPRPLRPCLQLASPIPLRQVVTICQGPERVETCWWDSNQIQRDYFIARMITGKWCWVFRTPEKQWYLQGYFA